VLKHVKEEAFPFLKNLGDKAGSFGEQMENAEFKINKPASSTNPLRGCPKGMEHLLSLVDDYRALLTHDGDSYPDEVVRASAINEESAYWERELLKSSPMAHAISDEHPAGDPAV
jgi:hypothetical protein